MKIPSMSMPVKRTQTSVFFESSVALSACPPGIPSSELGSCAIGGKHPGVVNRMNCAACCALRDSLSWFNANQAVNC